MICILVYDITKKNSDLVTKIGKFYNKYPQHEIIECKYGKIDDTEFNELDGVISSLTNKDFTICYIVNINNTDLDKVDLSKVEYDFNVNQCTENKEFIVYGEGKPKPLPCISETLVSHLDNGIVLNYEMTDKLVDLYKLGCKSPIDGYDLCAILYIFGYRCRKIYLDLGSGAWEGYHPSEMKLLYEYNSRSLSRVGNLIRLEDMNELCNFIHVKIS